MDQFKRRRFFVESLETRAMMSVGPYAPCVLQQPVRGALVVQGPLFAGATPALSSPDVASDSAAQMPVLTKPIKIVSASAAPSIAQGITVAGPVTKVTGTHHEQVRIMPPDNGVVDLTGGTFLALEDTMYPESKAAPATWPTQSQIGQKNDLNAGYTASTNKEMFPVAIVGTGKNITVTGGYIHGTMNPLAPWHIWKDLSDGDGLRTEGTGMATVKNVRIDNVSDGYSPNGPAGSTFLIKDSKFTRIHDDIIEDDSIHSGTISNIYAEGHAFLSHRGSSNSSAVVNIDHVVVKLILQPHYGDHDPSDISGPYKNGTYTDHLGNGTLFKWSSGGGKVNVSDSVFLVPRYSTAGVSGMIFPPGTYKNVTVVWLGPGDWPTTVPPGVTITRDTTIFDKAKAAWDAAHPGL